MKRFPTIAVIVVASAVLVLLAGTAVALRLAGRGPFREQPPPAKVPADLSQARPGAQPARAHGGGAGRAVTLEVFEDFQCPPCGQLHPKLKKVEEEYGERLRVVFRHLPLTSLHKHAMEAALAAEAAAQQGRFWAMRDLLFERQDEWSAAEQARPLFVEYARGLWLDVEQFERDMDAPETKARVEADAGRGYSARVSGTPTVFLEGRELPCDEWTPEGMRAAIDAALGGRASR